MNTLKRIALLTLGVPSLLAPALAGGIANAAAPNTTPSTTATTADTSKDATSTATTKQTNEAQRLATIKSKGDAEISRRLTALSALSSKVSAATKLTASDKATLNAEITTEIAGLTALKTKLDGETTIAAAVADVQSMVTEYRVYALIVPKVHLLRLADDQQAAQTKLSDLAAKLQTRITTAQTAGKDVAVLQTQLEQLLAQIAAAKAISSSIEAKVISLQPSDYNTDHTILSGAAAQLKTAHQDNQAAYQLAKTIVNGLKALN